mgnify:CR=1 FL=1
MRLHAEHRATIHQVMGRRDSVVKVCRTPATRRSNLNILADQPDLVQIEAAQRLA